MDENDVGIQCRRNKQSETSEIRQNWRMEREKGERREADAGPCGAEGFYVGIQSRLKKRKRPTMYQKNPNFWQKLVHAKHK